MKEEVKESNQVELEGSNKEKSCCCLVVAQDDFKNVSAHSKDLGYFMAIKDTRDYYHKKKRLEKREDELGCCKINCCHNLADFISRDTQSCLSEIDNILIFSFCFGWLFYILLVFLLMPFLWIYNCCAWLVAWCHRRDSRTGRILDLYRSYESKIADIYENK